MRTLIMTAVTLFTLSSFAKTQTLLCLESGNLESPIYRVMIEKEGVYSIQMNDSSSEVEQVQNFSVVETIAFGEEGFYILKADEFDVAQGQTSQFFTFYDKLNKITFDCEADQAVYSNPAISGHN